MTDLEKALRSGGTVMDSQGQRTVNDLIAQHFPDAAAPLAEKVMKAESSGNPIAINKNKNGTADHGLFQINDVNIGALKKAGIIKDKRDLYDPETNVKAAAFLHSQKGFQPWDSSKKVWAKDATDLEKALAAGGVRVDEGTASKKSSGITGSWEDEPMTVGGFAKNVGKDVKGIATSTYNMIRHPIDTVGGLGQFGKEFITNQDFRDELRDTIIDKLSHPLRTAYESPVSTALTVAPVVGGVGKVAKASGLIGTADTLATVSKLAEPATAVSKMASKAENLTSRLINSDIKPKIRDFAYGKNPGKGVIDEGIIATSKKDLAEKIAVARDGVGKQLEQVYAAPEHMNKIIDASDMTGSLDSAIRQASRNPRTNKALIDRLTAAKLDILQAEELPDGNYIFKRDLSNMKPADALQLKRDLGDIAKWTGSASDDAAVNKSLKSAYHAIDTKLDTAIPESKGLNERYANLSGAYSATRNRDAILSRQDMLHLKTGIVGTSVGAMSGILHGTAGAAVAPALAAAVLYEVLGSTLSKTAIAQLIKKLGYVAPKGARISTDAARAGMVNNAVQQSVNPIDQWLTEQGH